MTDGEHQDEIVRLKAHIGHVERQRDEALADNAALLIAARDWLAQMEVDQECSCYPDDPCPWHRVKSLVAHSHPGAALLEEHRKALAAAAARHETTRATMQVMREQHAKALVRARNEGLERAAAKARAVANEARRRRDSLNTNTPMGASCYRAAEEQMDTAGVLADDIDAMKEPE